MIQANISTVKSRFSSYLDQVKGGEQVVISDRTHPIAMLIPYERAAGSEQWAARLALLSRSGSIAPARTRKSKLVIVPVDPDKIMSLTAALLKERREGR
jgi:prevent-host-death family protein